MGIYKRLIRKRIAKRAVSRRWGKRTILNNKIFRQQNLVSQLPKQLQKVECKSSEDLRYSKMAEWLNRVKRDDKAIDKICENVANRNNEESFSKEQNFNKLLEFVRKAVQSDSDVEIDELRNAVGFMQSWKRKILQDMFSN